MSVDYLKLMLVTKREKGSIDEYLEFIKRSVRGGITSCQLREKESSWQLVLDFGKKLKEILDPFNIPLIINDDFELAQKLDAAGVHLGQRDANPIHVRKLLGPDKIIGLSIESLSELDKANNLHELNYVAASAVYATKNKDNLKKIWGEDGLQDFVVRSKHPVIAIGGLNRKNILRVMKTGVFGIVVIGAIHEASNPEDETLKLRSLIDKSF